MRSAPCPTCHRKTAWQDNPFRPFCSDRCRVLDLGAWASGKFRIAGDPVPEQTPLAGDDDQD